MSSDKLMKILALTGSSNDNEALVALRTAQAIMKTEKITWGEVLPKRRDREKEIIKEYNDVARRHNELLAENEVLKFKLKIAELQSQRGFFARLFG